MAVLSSQTIHACFAVAFRTQAPARFVTGEIVLVTCSISIFIGVRHIVCIICSFILKSQTVCGKVEGLSIVLPSLFHCGSFLGQRLGKCVKYREGLLIVYGAFIDDYFYLIEAKTSHFFLIQVTKHSKTEYCCE